MKIAPFPLDLLYKSFYLYDPEIIELDGNDIGTDVTDRQGFAWKPGHVDFYTLREDNFSSNQDYSEYGIDIEVFLNEPLQLSPDAVRTIQVPFSVTSNNGIIIGSGLYVGDPDSDNSIEIPPGNYAVTFEQGWKYNPQPLINPSNGETEGQFLYSLWGRLWFNTEENTEAKILAQDPRDTELNPRYPLQMDGKPL
jgi:Competence protein J (ComJ)